MRYKIIVIVVAMFLLNGINNLKEIKDLAIVSAIGIDKVDENSYKVSALIINPEKSESGGNSSSSSGNLTIYEYTDSSIQEAIRNMILESPRKLYLAHMKLLIISESVAENDLESSMDFFVRDDEGSNDFLFVIAKDTKPSEALKVNAAVEETPTENIIESIKACSRYIGMTTENELNNSLKCLLEDGEEMAMPSIRVEKSKEKEDKDVSSESGSSKNGEGQNQDGQNKEEKEEKVLVETLAYFKGSRFKGYLSKEDSIAYTMLKNKFRYGIFELNDKDRIVIELIKSKCEMKPRYENGKYMVDININADANITEMDKSISNINSSDIKRYEHLAEEKIYEYINNYIYNCQNKYESDLIGYKKLYRKKLNKEFKKIETIFYDNIFKNIKTNINVNINIPNDGGINI